MILAKEAAENLGTAIGLAAGIALSIAETRHTSFLERTYCHPQMEKRLEASECLSTQVFGPVSYSEESDNPLTA